MSLITTFYGVQSVFIAFLFSTSMWLYVYSVHKQQTALCLPATSLLLITISLLMQITTYVTQFSMFIVYLASYEAFFYVNFLFVENQLQSLKERKSMLSLLTSKSAKPELSRNWCLAIIAITYVIIIILIQSLMFFDERPAYIPIYIVLTCINLVFEVIEVVGSVNYLKFTLSKDGFIQVAQSMFSVCTVLYGDTFGNIAMQKAYSSEQFSDAMFAAWFLGMGALASCYSVCCVLQAGVFERKAKSNAVSELEQSGKQQ